MNPQPQPKAPNPVELLSSIVVCLLRDKAEQTDLKKHFYLLMQDRHKHTCIKKPTEEHDPIKASWENCQQPNCRYARELLAKESHPSAVINGFSMKIASQKTLKMKAQGGFIYVWMDDGPAVDQGQIVGVDENDPKKQIVIATR